MKKLFYKVLFALLLVQAADVNAQGAFKHLILTHMCSENPSQMVRWRIKNQNNYPVTYTWKIVDGGLTAPASSQLPQPFVALPGDNFIYVKRWHIGNNVLAIYVDGREQPAGRKAAGNTVCSTFGTYLTCIKKIDACTRQATFGYYNSNTNTTINVPLGANNKIEKGTVYSGQPVASFPPGNYPNAFKVRYACTDTLRWTLVGPFGSKTAYTTASFDSSCRDIMKIFVSYIEQLPDGRYSAVFGYENTGDEAIVINDAAKNYLLGDNAVGTPPQTFYPGRNEQAFTAKFTGDGVKWHVVNDEGTERIALADIMYAGHHVKPLKNFVKCIRHHNDGTSSAVFGYENLDTVPVSIPAGGGRNYLIYEADGQLPVTLFEPGKYDSVMSINFSGDKVKWALRGPEGIMHYAIASDEYCKVCDEINQEVALPPSQSMIILPNPVIDHLLVSHNLPTNVSKSVLIYDSMGNKILSKTFSIGQIITVNICNLRRGAYVLKVISGNSTLQKGFMKL